MGLPDGELPTVRDTLTKEIAQAIQTLGVTRIHTLGQSGYDGHPDHQATHQAATDAVRTLELLQPPRIWALNAAHSGELRTTGDPYRKLGAMACHISQFALDDPQFWHQFSLYTPLIWEQETYDRFVG